MPDQPEHFRSLWGGPEDVGRRRISTLITRCSYCAASEYVNCGKCRFQRQTVPEVHRKTDVAGPEGVATTAELIARLAALGYSGCGERSGAFEPHRIACSAIELEKKHSHCRLCHDRDWSPSRADLLPKSDCRHRSTAPRTLAM